MKPFFIVLLLISSPLLLAQERSKASPPVIVAKIPFGETVQFEDFSITFSKVIEDSRCPSDVTCVWAGQAKVLAIIKTEKETIENELIFHGTATGSENENTVFLSNNKKYIGYQLSPYPETSLPIIQRTYFLDILIVNKEL
ncbi:MAG: hypothetical protein NXH73_09610 [Flavobacteriaceae bacterium]|nr:hypothetical protein [Flavobacteriaceae bacterium]